MIHDSRITAAHFQDVIEKKYDADHHHDRAAGVGDGHRPKAADGRVDDYRKSEQNQPQLVAVAGDCGEKLGAAYELRGHRRAKEQHDDECRHSRQCVGAEPSPQDVHHRHGAEFSSQQRNALSENAQHEKDRRDLNHRHVNPAEADAPGHAGTADKRADGAVCRDGGHGQHEAAEIAVSDEIMAEKSAFACLCLPAYKEADTQHRDHEKRQRQKRFGTSRINHGAHPPNPCP